MRVKEQLRIVAWGIAACVNFFCKLITDVCCLQWLYCQNHGAFLGNFHVDERSRAQPTFSQYLLLSVLPFGVLYVTDKNTMSNLASDYTLNWLVKGMQICLSKSN